MSTLPDFEDSELTPATIEATVEDALTEVGSPNNPYSELVEEARDNLLRLMHGTDSEKISKEISLEILDRAGETKKADANAAVMINVNITDDDVKIMMAAAQEVRRG